MFFSALRTYSANNFKVLKLKSRNHGSGGDFGRNEHSLTKFSLVSQKQHVCSVENRKKKRKKTVFNKYVFSLNPHISFERKKLILFGRNACFLLHFFPQVGTKALEIAYCVALGPKAFWSKLNWSRSDFYPELELNLLAPKPCPILICLGLF